jgi:hypothetical protein
VNTQLEGLPRRSLARCARIPVSWGVGFQAAWTPETSAPILARTGVTHHLPAPVLRGHEHVVGPDVAVEDAQGVDLPQRLSGGGVRRAWPPARGKGAAPRRRVRACGATPRHRPSWPAWLRSSGVRAACPPAPQLGPRHTCCGPGAGPPRSRWPRSRCAPRPRSRSRTERGCTRPAAASGGLHGGVGPGGGSFPIGPPTRNMPALAAHSTCRTTAAQAQGNSLLGFRSFVAMRRPIIQAAAGAL